ncbi:MAG: squalene synthase HpnC [Planctomycetota bacterium]
MTPPKPDTMAARDDRAAFLSLAAEHYENFPVGSILVPKRLRPHMHRIYAFARIADDIADERRDAALLEAFRADFLEHVGGAPSRPLPLFADLAVTVRELDLPVDLFTDLLDAFAQDLEVRRYATADELFAYCRLSADPVGRLVLRVFGHRDPALDALSDRICTGLQLLNHLQDIREDLLERDRVYFPLADLQRYGVSEDALRGSHADPAVRALVECWLDRTMTLFAEGWPLTAAVGGRLKLELRAIVGAACLAARRIQAAGHDVLAGRVRLSRFDHVRALCGACVGRRPVPLRARRSEERA